MRVVPSLILGVALAATSAMAAQPGLWGPFSGVVAFGDSLSDNGRGYQLSAYPPSPPYWQGRSSNGPVAVERLAADLGLSTNLVDWAQGGSKTGATGVLGQVDGFRSQLGGAAADPAAVYFLWAGGNDLLAADPGLTLDAAADVGVANLVTAVRRLHGVGAQIFEVPLLPDLAGIPALSSSSAENRAAFAAATERFDTRLAAAMRDLAASTPGIRIVTVDPRTLQAGLIAATGITNTTSACLSPNRVACATPDRYQFWDTVHPTAVVHAYWGDAFYAALVPEPPVTALLLAGLAALTALTVLAGSTRRTRREAPALDVAADQSRPQQDERVNRRLRRARP